MSKEQLIAHILKSAFIAKTGGKHGEKTRLAKRIGVSDSQLGRYLKGTRTPSADELIILAKELDIPPGLFWAITGQADEADTAMIELVSVLNKIAPDQRAATINALLQMLTQLRKND